MLDAVRSGDAAVFAALAERCRRPLLAHCYRMLGSIDDAEDPHAMTVSREGIELAFLAALQHLPSRSRVVSVIAC